MGRSTSCELLVKGLIAKAITDTGAAQNPNAASSRAPWKFVNSLTFFKVYIV
jgi:hypothetical protein